MKIKFVQIQNFRKLQSCRIDFSETETIFVGANNSGKTTAMDAMRTFLGRKEFKTQDFTLSNWKELNKIGEIWANGSELVEKGSSINKLEPFLPSLDLWIEVEDPELHYVSHIIPTLDWKGGLLGVRLRYEPKDIQELIQEFSQAYKNSKQLLRERQIALELWPQHFWDFCEKKLSDLFTFKTYLLDPDKVNEAQDLSDTNSAIDGDVLKGLIRVDIVDDQRIFKDANTEYTDNTSQRNLSAELRAYYDKHLNPSVEPTNKDLEALQLINTAEKAFDQNLKESFTTPLAELEGLNYPGFGNPRIQISAKISTSDGLRHGSAIKYHLGDGLSLPEKYNGLGYKHLIFIIFKLIQFRDAWMREGNNSGKINEVIEPLHLVLIEEPEAHLHAQVQQVFMKKAYDVLRNHSNLKENSDFSTQLVISTHSSYIAHQKFQSLRYFKRNTALPLPTTEVVSLFNVFGDNEKETEKFVIRYLNTTHNDLFFADAVILVEGSAERILFPHFIKNFDSVLDSCYLTILEIGGSHAHRLKPLIEKLGIICLVVTDIDSSDNGKKCRPEINKGLKTKNNTLKEWHPRKESIDELLNLGNDGKVKTDLPIRVAYQGKIKIKGEEIYPYTFEDALVIENLDIFKAITDAEGSLKKIAAAAKQSAKDSAESVYNLINSKEFKKAEFALHILYSEDPSKIEPPTYIKDGLQWVVDQLTENKLGLINS